MNCKKSPGLQSLFIYLKVIMKIVVYSKNSCPNCTIAKDILKARDLPYEEINLDNNPEKVAEFVAQHPGVRQMPQIFVEGQRVGGVAGLQAALKQIDEANKAK